MRNFFGFNKIPDAAKFTRFKQDFCDYIHDLFERLVDLTEPICRKMDKALSDLLFLDTTGIESYVAENNTKFPRAKAGTAFGYSGAAASNPQGGLQYINGCICYAQHAAVVTNGLGIVRHLELLGETSVKSTPKCRGALERNCLKQIKDRRFYGDLACSVGFRAAYPNFRCIAFRRFRLR